MNRKSTKVLVETWRRFLSESEESSESQDNDNPLNAPDFNEIEDVNEPDIEGEPLPGDDENSVLSDEKVIKDYKGDI